MEDEAVLRGLGVALAFVVYQWGIRPLARLIERWLQARKRPPSSPSP
jgi:hypothetical protein